VSYYGRHISGLWLSTTADYAENELADPVTETFTATKFIEDLGRTMTANYGQGLEYNLSTWTSIDLIQVTNTGTTLLEVDWNATGITYTYVPAGRTVIIPLAYPSASVFVLVWCIDPVLPGSANVTILGT
jgi:hypothetical protein